MFAGGSQPRHLLCSRGTLRDRRWTSGALTNSNSLLRGPGGASSDARAFPCSPCLAYRPAKELRVSLFWGLFESWGMPKNLGRMPHHSRTCHDTLQVICGPGKRLPRFAGEAPMELELLIITNLVVANATPNTAPGWSGTAFGSCAPVSEITPEPPTPGFMSANCL